MRQIVSAKSVSFATEKVKSLSKAPVGGGRKTSSKGISSWPATMVVLFGREIMIDLVSCAVPGDCRVLEYLRETSSHKPILMSILVRWTSIVTTTLAGVSSNHHRASRVNFCRDSGMPTSITKVGSFPRRENCTAYEYLIACTRSQN